ncbi:hypothetical protein AAFF_G00237920 [Aldrovandia affinis]|uniref:Pre-B-cell leukemia transcription factor-interacting protein 1-like n=1 Tax=Aldrovandia affinis TaxID=143900 RepID=A0AAD7REF3_9TELE|nr:hypothetical protein AAFF_G00237920 [Aldrovandia affinis]
MSDNSDSTNSNGLISSWPGHIPEEAPVQNVGPEDDGKESLAEISRLSEDVTGSVTVPEAGTARGIEAPAEGAVPEEGPQVSPAPPEAPVENVGPWDDGKESLDEAPSFSEEVTGAVAEAQTGDSEAPAEVALSEEGLQVCQETALEVAQGSAPSSPTVLSPSPTSHVPLISDLESYTPFSLDTDAYTVTSPDSGTESLNPVSSAPDIYTHISSSPEDTDAVSPSLDGYTHIGPVPERLPAVGPASDSYTDISPEPFTALISAPDADTHISPAPENITAVGPASDAYMDISPEPESFATDSPASDADTYTSPAPEHPTPVSLYPDSITSASTPASQEGEEPQQEEEVSEPAKMVADDKPQEDFRDDCAPGEGDKAMEEDGLRRRHAPPPAPPDPPRRSRVEEEDEDEEEFHLIQRKEEGGGLSLNKCIVGALVLLCLGSIIFTGFFIDVDDEEDSDVAQARDPKLPGNQEWLNPDSKPPNPQEMTQLLGKLAEESQQMTRLQAQLQSQKEELGLVLQKVDVMGKDPPAGQTENHSSAADGRLLDEKRKEKVLEQSGPGQERAREEMEGAKADTESMEGAREEKEKERTEVVEKPEGRLGGKKRHWEGGEKEARREGHQEKEWKKGREEVKEWKQKEERKERKTESDWKHGKDGGKDKRREWREKRQKLENSRPPVDCRGIAECARKEGLVPVKQAEFQSLMGAYLSRLEGAVSGSKGAITALVGEFFVDGLFAHHKLRFREFAEDVADMLEDAVEGDHRAEDAMEEFEREALRKFAVAGGGEREGRKWGKDGRVWG